MILYNKNMYRNVKDAYFTYDIWDGPYRQCEESYKPTENDALKFTTNVIAALKQSTDPRVACNLFSEDAVLFATLSGDFKTTNHEIFNYFQNFY